MMDCDTCLNAKPVLQKDGIDYVCTLRKVEELHCLMGIENNYILHPMCKVGDVNE